MLVVAVLRWVARLVDSGLSRVFLVPDWRDASPVPTANFSVKEKDEASLFRPCGRGFAECLYSPICRG
jgi:hypothetical protein